MLPILNPLPPSGAGVVPPAGFRKVTDLQSAWLSQHPPFFAKSAEERPSVAQLAGVRFEKKVHTIFEALQLPSVRVSPWFTFRDAFGTRWCQPDLLIEHKWTQVIVEVKHNHTTDAWFQLRELYEPVVKKAMDMAVRCMVVVEHFDPAVPWPEPYELLAPDDSFRKWFSGDSKLMGIVRCP